jgi:hypothetical protein
MRSLGWYCGLVAVVVVGGCGGPRLIQPKGRVLKGGAPLALKEDEHVNVFFVPVIAEGEQHPGDVYAARYNDADGSFQATGKDGKGLPPGKYKITVEHFRKKKDLLGGKFSSDNSPFVRDVTDAATELLIDLDKPNG